MEEITIKGNGVPREIVYGFELTEKEKEEFDWMDIDELPNNQFFRFKGQVYALSEIMDLHNKIYQPNPPEWMKKFDGYMSDSYFSGILVKFGSNDFPNDMEYVRVYTYYS